MDTKHLDKHNLKNRFPQECELLPFEYLTENEKKLANKCINQETLTDEEIIQLKKLLADYRPFFNRYNTNNIEENIDTNIKVINTSRELLRLLDDPDRYRFDMHYKIKGQLFRLKLRMKPLSDKDYIELLDAQTRVFRDLTKSEKVIYTKAANNIPLSPEEEKMQQHIQDKIVEKLGDVDKNNDMITHFLINHVELVGDENLDKNERETFWKNIDLGTRVLIYHKCKEIAKIDEELEVDLFPAIR
ncbi:hypothetical protein MBORA_16190 [Methanobrevibacter oralis]|uniref:Uncharacterized protein n=2 Tax=Methanobrevibacter oralis TaxID=66851 RepID=A0A165ZZK2_METOA|nr:hypothetical protein [Methanobrevibacter oralis]KZX11374.1 hypothetical protein MBORA_16190 [Methanobrevibacter oralis]